MVISKSLRALKKKGNTVTVLLENKQDLSEALLFERGAIAALTGTEKSNIYKDYKEPVDAYGCLGVLQLSNTDQSYLLLVTGCNSIGRILEVEICRVSQVTVVTMGATAAGGQQQPDQITEMVKFLSSGAFFFSYPSTSSSDSCFQLCSSAQYRAVNGNTSPPQHFLWNRALLAPLIHYGVDCDHWMLRLMCGSVEVKTLYCGRHQARACLISRFGCERAGTRFSVRGIDDNGQVAGFVETEQVIVLLDKLTSFIQLRGSVPIFWEQSALQGVGNHRILLSQEYHFSHIAFEKHIEWLISNYGPQVIINLLGNKEGEQKLSTEYQKHVHQSAYSSDIPMVTFDYNSQCKGHDQTKLSTMMWAKTRETVDAFGYFAMEGGHMTRKQVGTIRTNCMDCMDRTNVVQCFFGLKVLEKQLLEYDLGGSSSIVSQFEDVFRSMWSHNGNNLSMWYTGSAALSKKDRFKDGAISLHRTIHSNFYDSSKQEAIELLLWAGVLDDELGHVSRALLPPSDVFNPRCYREELCGRYLEYTERIPLRVCMGTWNVNGGKYTQSIAYKNQKLSTWLLDTPMAGMTGLGDYPPDIYAIGLEELVDLNASNIMSTSSTNRKYWSTEIDKILSNHGHNYVMLTAHQLVGVCLFVFVQPQLVPLIRDVALSTVKTGMSGKAGNKGAVGISMIVQSSPICFVCAHMTAHQSHVNERNSDFTDIWRKMTFPNNVTLSSHEYVFWCGDLNYRIDLPIDVVKEAILSQNWSLLQQNDQLLKSKYDGKAFHGFIEGELKFAPTYKYDSFSDDYDTSEKGRIPAWTDRVMWWNQSLFKSIDPVLSSNQTVLPSYETVVSHPTDVLKVRPSDPNSNPGLLMFYGRSELKTSDHRPVIAIIDVEVLQVKPDQRDIVARDVTLSLGPPDCTVVISGGVDWELIQSELIQCGDIIFVRVFEEQLIVTFKDSKSALVAMQLDGLQVEDKILHVELRSEWPPPEVTEEQATVHPPKIKLTTPKLTIPLNISDLGSSPTGSPHLSPRGSPSTSPRMSPNHSPHITPRESPQNSPKQSPQVSPRESPHVSARQSPNVSPRDSPRGSLHSSPYHSAEESPYNSPGESPQQSPVSSPRESPQPSRLAKEDNELTISDQQPTGDKPVVSSRTVSTSKVPTVSQYHEEISKARRRSTPVEASSGIGQPYNIKHQAHGQQVGDKLVINKPTSAAANKKPAPPQRPPNPVSLSTSKSDQPARLTSSGSLDTSGPPRRPPPPNRPQSDSGSQGKPPPPRPPQPVKK